MHPIFGNMVYLNVKERDRFWLAIGGQFGRLVSRSSATRLKKRQSSQYIEYWLRPDIFFNEINSIIQQ